MERHHRTELHRYDCDQPMPRQVHSDDPTVLVASPHYEETGRKEAERGPEVGPEKGKKLWG